VIRQYLGLGHRLVQLGHLKPTGAWARMLELLLQTAGDEGLPWFWRSVCLDHAAQPMARCLRSSPSAVADWQRQVEALHADLAQAMAGTAVPARGEGSGR
jgi:hypothetical protein